MARAQQLLEPLPRPYLPRQLHRPALVLPEPLRPDPAGDLRRLNVQKPTEERRFPMKNWILALSLAACGLMTAGSRAHAEALLTPAALPFCAISQTTAAQVPQPLAPLAAAIPIFPPRPRCGSCSGGCSGLDQGTVCQQGPATQMQKHCYDTGSICATDGRPVCSCQLYAS
jgi:hypothetical protein